MLIKNGRILENGKLIKKDILISADKIVSIDDDISVSDTVIDVSGCWVIPGTIDVHAHFREPGFENKGTVKTESASAAKGGIVTAMAMPNLNPTPDSLQALQVEEEIINKDSVINIYPYAAVTKGESGKELADINGLCEKVKAFTDDGKGYTDMALLREAMSIAKVNNKIIASHAEYEGLGLSPASEYKAVERELKLAAEIGCKYHFCHISTKQAFDMIKNARLNGVDVTCEVTPHHIALNEDAICGDTNFKMNPPLRSEIDRLATIDALLSGVATMIATDHAPHSESDKAVKYDNAPNGVIGFETMLPVAFTVLVKSGLASYDKFLDWVVYNPASRFNLPYNKIAVGGRADLAVLDIDNARVYTKEKILSKGKNSPFIGKSFYGFNRLTVLDGKVLYKDI